MLTTHKLTTLQLYTSIIEKIAEVLNTLPGVEGVRSHIPHLEREKIFGSTKKKLNVPINDGGDSHIPNKIIFSQPYI